MNSSQTGRIYSPLSTSSSVIQQISPTPKLACIAANKLSDVSNYSNIDSVTDYSENDTQSYTTTSRTLSPFGTTTFNNSNLIPQQLYKKATIFSSCMNLSNTVLGAGLLGLPYAISKTGYLYSFFLFLIFMFLSALGLHLSMCVSRLSSNASYYALSELSIPRIKKLVDFAVAVKCFGVATSYLIVIGDLMPAVAKEFIAHSAADEPSSNLFRFQFPEIFLNRHLWIIIFVVIFIIPIVRFKKFNALRFTSIFALICFIYISIIILLYATVPSWIDAINNSTNVEKRNEKHVQISFSTYNNVVQFLRVIPIFIFSFTCHQNSFSITNELHNVNISRINSVIFTSLIFCLLVYFIIGYAGYSTYGSAVKSDILLLYPQAVQLAVVRVCLSIALAWSYPLQCHPCRKCIASLLWNKKIEQIENEWKFYIITYLMVGASFLIAMVVNDLGVVLEIVGATGSTIISYILPGVFYYYVEFPKLRCDAYHGLKKKSAMFLIVFGCFIMPFTLVMHFL